MPFTIKNREALGLPKVSTRAKPEFGLKPTPSQQVAREGITEWICDPDAPSFARLIGPAGTGKSATAGLIVCDVVSGSIPGNKADNLTLAAPTHKACREAEGKLALFGIKLGFQTTSRLLCLEESISANGEQKFVQKRLPDFGAQHGVFIIDEMSMVSQYQINCLTTAIEDLNEKREVMEGLPPAKVLLVGDDRQLTPVGEPLNNLFKLDIPEFRLTEIVRHTGPVLEQSIRTRAVTSRRPGFSTVDDGKEVWVTSSNDRFEIAFIKALRKAHAEEDYSRVVALASTNKRVSELCEKARIALFGAHPEPFQTGERLISTNAVKKFAMTGWQAMICHSTTEIIVVDKTERFQETGFLMGMPRLCDNRCPMPLRALRRHLLSNLPVNEKVDTENLLDDDDGLFTPMFSVYEVNAYLPDIPDPYGQPTKIVFTSVVDEDKTRFKQFCTKLKTLILRSDLPTDVRRALWRVYYYPLMALDAPVQSALAMTIHRSQGSTIPEVFVDFENIDKTLRRSQFDHNRAAYTAVTRASQFLGILDPTNSEELA